MPTAMSCSVIRNERPIWEIDQLYLLGDVELRPGSCDSSLKLSEIHEYTSIFRQFLNCHLVSVESVSPLM